MGQHTSENRALIEELKQDLIVNSILEEQVKQKSAEYTERLEALQLQVSKVKGLLKRVDLEGKKSHCRLCTRGIN